MLVQKKESPRPGTREFAANDLRKLIGQSQEEFKVEEDMPPLLQVINWSGVFMVQGIHRQSCFDSDNFH